MISQLSPARVELGATDERGQLRVQWDTRIDAVFRVVPYCGGWDRTVSLASLRVAPAPSREISLEIELQPLPMDAQPWWHPGDCEGQPGGGLRIGIVDSGCGPHPALAHVVLAGSWIQGNRGDQAQTRDCERHGTHVAGIVAATRLASCEIHGLAHAATTTCIRVAKRTEEGKTRLTNGDIATAIDTLVEEHSVDLLNLSLGGEEFDSDEHDALRSALERGVLPLAAAGNYGHLVYPAAYDGVVAVGALGRWGEGSADARRGFYVLDQGRPANDPHEFYVPDSSMYEDPVDCFSPGVEILSTVPATEDFSGPYAAMTGSSMAVAVVTGVLARALATDGTYRGLPRNSRRAEHARAVLRELSRARRTLGGVRRPILLA